MVVAGHTGSCVVALGALVFETGAVCRRAQEAGAVTISYGLFVNSVISFIIVAFAVFLLIRGINNMQAEEEEPEKEVTTKDCPFCVSSISIDAKRCPNCTSEL